MGFCFRFCFFVLSFNRRGSFVHGNIMKYFAFSEFELHVCYVEFLGIGWLFGGVKGGSLLVDELSHDPLSSSCVILQYQCLCSKLLKVVMVFVVSLFKFFCCFVVVSVAFEGV